MPENWTKQITGHGWFHKPETGQQATPLILGRLRLHKKYGTCNHRQCPSPVIDIWKNDDIRCWWQHAFNLIGHRMTSLLTITSIAPPLSPPLEKYVHSLFRYNISIFDWLQTTAAIPTPPCPALTLTLTPLPLVQIVNLTITMQLTLSVLESSH